MDNGIEKTEQPNPDDVLTAITSFNDPSIIVGIFKELGWTYSFEIKEWLSMARQNANLAVKSKALIQLRKLLREAAESSGYIANISSTTPNAHGGSTTFHAKRIAGILNPVKKIESTEIKGIQDDQTKEPRIESDRRCDRSQSETSDSLGGGNERNDKTGKLGCEHRKLPSTPIRDTGCAFPIGDVDSGGTEPEDGGETSGSPGEQADDSSNPCIKTRPPTCDHTLFPGISSAED